MNWILKMIAQHDREMRQNCGEVTGHSPVMRAVDGFGHVEITETFCTRCGEVLEWKN